MIRAVHHMLRPLARRIRLLVTRGVVKLIDDTAGLQRLQLSGRHGELLDAVERLQQYGVTCHPHPGASAAVLNVGGSRAHPIVIAVDDRRYRLELAEGEVALYDDLGQTIRLGRGGIVTEAPFGHTHHGDLAVQGDLDVSGSITAPAIHAANALTVGGIDVGSHVHPILDGSSAPGPTGGPQ